MWFVTKVCQLTIKIKLSVLERGSKEVALSNKQLALSCIPGISGLQY